MTKQKAAARKRKKAVADPAASASFQEFESWQNEAPVADDAYVCPWNPEADDDFDPWQAEKKNLEDSTFLQSQQSKIPGAMQAVTLEAGSQLLSSSTEKSKQSQTDKNGADPIHARARWQKPCPRKKCSLPGCAAKSLNLKQLQRLCKDFWGISSEERIHLLPATYGDSPDSHAVQYFLCDTRVCFANFCAKLGTGQHTMGKYMKGQPGMRKKQLGNTRLQAKGREAYLALKCDHFFQELQSVGEPLPEDEETGSADDPWFQGSPTNCLFAIIVGKFREPFPDQDTCMAMHHHL